MVVHRRVVAVTAWRSWLRGHPLVHPYKWHRPGSPCSFFCSVILSSLLVVLVFWLMGRIDEEFRKAWLPYFCLSGERETSLEEFTQEVDGWLPLLPEVSLPRLTSCLGLCEDVAARGLV